MNEDYGFLLVTADPATVDGGVGYAWELVQYRIARCCWPIYANTRNRKKFCPGREVAFYVGGVREHAGEIVAVAMIRAVENAYGKSVDPEQYLTPSADLVLRICDVHYLEKPIRLRERVEYLSFKPVNMRRWGVVLMGGCRLLKKNDWETLFK